MCRTLQTERGRATGTQAGSSATCPIGCHSGSGLCGRIRRAASVSPVSGPPWTSVEVRECRMVRARGER